MFDQHHRDKEEGGEKWPQEVWLNRFDDLPLEWWANPSTGADPDDRAGHALEACCYVPAPEHSQTSGLTDEDRERLLAIARILEGMEGGRSIFAPDFKPNAALLRKLAEQSSTGEDEGLREHLHATFYRWRAERLRQAREVVGTVEQAKLRAAASAFGNAADYALDATYPESSGEGK